MENCPTTASTQDIFLSYIKKHNIFLTIFLINGVKLQGIVTSFDSKTILLRRDNHSQLVYKNAISTLMPQASIPSIEDNTTENNGTGNINTNLGN